MVGARFGFVRLIRVRDVVNLIFNLRTFWMGTFHLYDDVARKGRVQTKRMGQTIPTKANMNSSVSKNNILGVKSFVAAVQQGSHDTWPRLQAYVQKKNDNYMEKQSICNKSNTPCLVKQTMELSDDVCLSPESSKSSFLAKVVNVQIIHRLLSILEINGLMNFQIRSIGGRWVWIDLDADNDLSSFRLSVEMNKIFTKFKSIDKDFVQDEKVVSLFVDIDKGIRVKVKGKYYDVSINELAYWALDDDCESNESSESDCSNGQNSHNSLDPKDFEERCTKEPVPMLVQERSNSDPLNLMGLIEKQGINLVTKDKETVINCDTGIEMEQSIPALIRIKIKEAMVNNTIDDGTEETKSYWPHGYTEFVSNIKRNYKDRRGGGTKCNSTRGSMESLNERSCTKGSRLDRFFIADSTWNHLGPLSAVALDRTISDHDPILLRQFMPDYGPIMFKIYHSWFQGDGFDKVVSDFWSKGHYRRSSSAMINLKKLQGLKGAIKVWVNTRRSRIDVIDSLREELRNLDLNIDDDLIQKSRIKWCTDEDENSNFFHGTVNNKRKQVSVRGINSNVDLRRFINTNLKYWNLKCHWKKLKLLYGIVAAINRQVQMGDIPIGCNASFITSIPKIESPLVVNDFRPISLIGVFYKIIAKIISCRIALIIDNIIDPVQYAFIKNRQILDGPMILNEVVHTFKRKKKKAMIFKVDIAKAHDTLSWDYLLYVIKFMRFDNKRMRLIKACLESARSSVLVNGSPTMEFQLHRGLRQGDPLAPFLFILAMEGFHIAMKDVIEAKKIVGINIGDICLSRLIYSDDVIVLGECYAIKILLGAEDKNMKIHWVKWELVLASKDHGGIVPRSAMKRKIGDGMNSLFWHDIWINKTLLAHQFPRLFLLEEMWLGIIGMVTIVQTKDSWRWSCDTVDSFSVNGLRKHLDCLTLPSHYLETRWNKIVPRKVNIHVWRLIKDRLPTCFNLWFHGIDNVSLICPMCSNGLESIYHVMSECIIMIKVWESIVKWLNLNLPFHLSPIEHLDFVNNKGNLNKAKDIIFTIIYTA
uniref:RNA-directed DNA polymerase, eukaryota, reverse transcriptase zinc-binding domain protein n=1 Tax=Tanacetum cinerariifolium TaxID=118510 RepID=A0A6L2KNH1_TANCI|nr:RNA-directed DNA polymerase, eukaryota, reverse transcriptase zinc-binding domain protein [Tanacetum cinerariifolium]